jgi:hypothetical protein
VNKAIAAFLKIPETDATEQQKEYIKKVLKSYYPKFD